MNLEIVEQIAPCMGPAITVDCMIERVSQMPETQYLFRGIVDPSLGVVFGPAKSGKSIFIESLLLTISSGQQSFIGDKLNSSSPKVLLFSLEEYFKSRTDRNKKQIDFINSSNNLSENWTQNFFVIDDSFPRYIHNEVDWDLLESQIDRIKPSVVLIDSLSRLTTHAIEDSVVAISLMKRLREIVHKYKIVLMVVHHTPKMDNKPLTISSLAGSRIIGQEVDFMIGINRTSQNVRYIKDVAYRYAPDDAEKVLKFKINENQIVQPLGYFTEAELLMGGTGDEFNHSDELVIQYFQENITPENDILKTAILYKDLVETRYISKPTLHEALNRLVNSGNIIKHQKGEWKLAIVS